MLHHKTRKLRLFTFVDISCDLVLNTDENAGRESFSINIVSSEIQVLMAVESYRLFQHIQQWEGHSVISAS
jgi:hypothetical protein